MNIPHHLAMTAAEFYGTPVLPERIAWMACHFGAGSKGLSNLPPSLPPGSLLVVDDSIPPNGHDPKVIFAQLSQCIREQEIAAVLLDLQRPGIPENAAISAYLVSKLPCPVCVSSVYAKDLDCPVFLSAPPPHCPLTHWIKPWSSRELWLEIALEAETIVVTEAGSEITSVSPYSLPELPLTDTELWCRYQVQVLEDRAVFTLARDREMAQKLLDAAQDLRISRTISLYQQMQ